MQDEMYDWKNAVLIGSLDTICKYFEYITKKICIQNGINANRSGEGAFNFVLIL